MNGLLHKYPQRNMLIFCTKCRKTTKHRPTSTRGMTGQYVTEWKCRRCDK